MATYNFTRNYNDYSLYVTPFDVEFDSDHCCGSLEVYQWDSDGTLHFNFTDCVTVDDKDVEHPFSLQGDQLDEFLAELDHYLSGDSVDYGVGAQ